MSVGYAGFVAPCDAMAVAAGSAARDTGYDAAGSATAAPGIESASASDTPATTLGSHTRRDCMAASRATSVSLRSCFSVSVHRTTERRVGARSTMSSMPISVSFCTDHSLRSPFTGTNATPTRCNGAASVTTSPSARSPPSAHAHERQLPRPSLAVTRSPSRTRNTRERWCWSVSVSEGESRWSTNTCATELRRASITKTPI